MEQRFGTPKKSNRGPYHKFDVEHVHQFEDGTITFNMMVDDFVTVYGCRIYDGKDGKPFISFPARKGNDGKFWNIVYMKLSEDQTEEIAKQIEEKLA